MGQSHRILLCEFLDEVSQRADADFNGRPHQAFLAWYVEAEFGRRHWQFTDDANDGGIDAVDSWIRFIPVPPSSIDLSLEAKLKA